jgi:CubicO group peptidase (beta-lactamase class C family)
LVWRYSNHTVQVIEAVLRNATGMAPDAYAEQHLWAPMGIKATWARDKTGHPAMYMNVKASCRDHARLGYLYLRDGCWKGKRLLPDGWVSKATGASSEHNHGYGWWWWRNGGEPVLDSVDFKLKKGRLHPFAPKDAFCAVGLGNQFVEVVPSLDLVVVRIGVAPPDDPKLLFKPKKLIAAMTADGKQVVHNELLKRVLAAKK